MYAVIADLGKPVPCILTAPMESGAAVAFAERLSGTASGRYSGCATGDREQRDATN